MALLDANQGGSAGRKTSWLRRFADPEFQARMAKLPLIGRIVRREGEAMFDLVAGFCHSQVLQALVKLDVVTRLLDGPMTASALTSVCAVPEDRMVVLLNAGAAIGVLKRTHGMYRLTPRGAALAGVPGLKEMIAHHEVLYRDLSDPVAFFRGEVDTELAAFWPYVFGAGAAKDPANAKRYSRLMSETQRLVAQDTLDCVSFSGVNTLMDVGGGTGTFLEAVGAEWPSLNRRLFDLPAVVQGATDPSLEIMPGSFRDDALPMGADAISLVRVLYDHNDQTVLHLLRKVHSALPVGGRLIISEPMTGSAVPERPGDAYFALYCMAMRTGRARSAEEITALLTKAGRFSVSLAKTKRPFVTSVINAVKKI